ncbi:TPA: hypothetical protein ACGJ08_004791 [Yersinia enterocolitica]|uniref:hypothetical protein n=1 Tax=Yersinia TaxID=629 RepID=UPI0005E46F51|nr:MULTISPECIES: hypothetical protein [Yersinia]CNJ53485.1 Uncharacterised protein [Yersinia mollaretii]CQD56488.1 Uncharacterised protein [Yersinia enterocolitica]HDW3097624.1 hypothetical protein [Yersinia enterocolitica]
MRKKQRNSNRSDVTQQRSAKPDELVMVCVDNPIFGHKLVEKFKELKAMQGKANE